MTQQFFYDKQIQRYLLQFVRIFSIFSVQKGYDSNGNPILERIPCRYGDISRNAAHILKQNSENFLNTVPFISCYITNLDMNDQWRTYPQQQRHANVIEKKFDYESQTYLEEDGQSYTVTRHAPVPYKLTMSVDIWTSNTDQKLQLLEQALILFNPTIDLYSDSNILDPSRLAYLKLLSTNWTSRTVPVGTDEIIDISTLQFEMTIHLNPPLKVSRLNIIQTIITELTTPSNKEDLNTWTNADFVNGEKQVTADDFIDNIETQFIIVTPGNYWVEYKEGKIELLKNGGIKNDDLSWKNDIFNNYGAIRPGVSQVRLRLADDSDDETKDIIGTINFDSENENKLEIDIKSSTLPEDTENDILSPSLNNNLTFFDPSTSSPPSSPQNGLRYLLTENLPIITIWNELKAEKNDIIEFNSEWNLLYDSSENLPNYKKDLHLDRRNTQGRGIWSDGETLWCLDGFDRKIYAYNLKTKTRDEEKDFDTLIESNIESPDNIWSDGETMWVISDIGFRNRSNRDNIYAFNMKTKERDTRKDFYLEHRVIGLWSNDETLYTLSLDFDKSTRTTTQTIKVYNIENYDLTEQESIEEKRDYLSDRRDETKDISLPSPSSIKGFSSDIWSDDETIWVGTNLRDDNGIDNRLEAYTLSTGDRDETKDISIEYTYPNSISSDGETIWILDGKRFVKTYDLEEKGRNDGDIVTISDIQYQWNGEEWLPVYEGKKFKQGYFRIYI